MACTFPTGTSPFCSGTSFRCCRCYCALRFRSPTLPTIRAAGEIQITAGRAVPISGLGHRRHTASHAHTHAHARWTPAHHLVNCMRWSISWFCIFCSRRTTPLALGPSGEIHIATRCAPPIWLVLLADVCRRAVSSAGGTTLLALSTTGKIDVAALQTLPIGRILPWAWATHATHHACTHASAHHAGTHSGTHSTTHDDWSPCILITIRRTTFHQWSPFCCLHHSLLHSSVSRCKSRCRVSCAGLATIFASVAACKVDVSAHWALPVRSILRCPGTTTTTTTTRAASCACACGSTSCCHCRSVHMGLRLGVALQGHAVGLPVCH
mmetsp:Transcript_16140/g.28244  ORF Transcript_16140/g.28244 Transcript_16140/m.28244 type:complete len:324 (+) Transcript_16140:530-1501(+)